MASCRLPLCLICLVALGLRLYQIRESLWIDELHTSWCVAADIGDVASRAHMGNNSPFYFYLVYGATTLLGHNELSLRLLSVVSGTLLVAVLYILTLRWTQSHILAALTSILATIDANFLFYSLEARPYVLVQLLSLIQAGIYIGLLRGASTARRVAFVVTGALTFYCHYTSAMMFGVFIVHYVFVQFVGKDKANYPWPSFLLDCLCIALICSAALPHLVEIADRRENWEAFVRRVPISHLLSIFPLWSSVGIAVVLVTVSPFVRSWRKASNDQHLVDWNMVAFLAIWLFVPLLVAWISTETNLARLYFRRYIICVAAAPMLLTSVLLTAIPTRWSRVVVVFAIIVLSLITGSTGRPILTEGKVVRHSREGWREAIVELNHQWQTRPGPLFLRSGLIEAHDLADGNTDAPLWEYCLFPLNAIYYVDSNIQPRIPLPTTDAGKLTDEQWNYVEQASRAWFLCRGTRATTDAMLRTIRQSASDRGMTVKFSRRGDFGNVALIRLDISG